MPTEIVLAVLGIACGAVGYIFKALSERGSLKANATSVVVEAARELVDPLRKELATERREHALETEADKAKLIEVRVLLANALDEAEQLRTQIAQLRMDMSDMETAYQRKISELEAELGHS